MPEAERPQVSDSRLRKDLRYGMWDAFVSTPIVYLSLPANVIMAALITQVFGLSKGTYGLLVSLPSWLNAAQLFIMPFVRMSPKRITVVFVWFQVLVWGAVAASVAFVPPEAATTYFLVFMLLSSIAGSLSGVGWTTWVRDWVPTSVRGSYFGRRNRLASLATIAFLLFATFITKQLEGSIGAYVFLLAIAVVARMFGLFCLHSTSESKAPPRQQKWVEGIRAVAGNRSFLLFVLFSANTMFWLNSANPFIPVFMYEVLGLSVSQATLFVVLNALAGAMVLPLWGRLTDKHGCVAVISLSVMFWMGQDYLWAVVTEDTRYILYFLWLFGGLVGPGFVLGTFNLLLKLVPRDHLASAVSFNTAATAITAAIAPVISGSILAYVEQSGADTEIIYRIAFVVRSSMVLLGLFVLRMVQEPPAQAEGTITGAMRSVRQVMVGQGLAFLANMHLTRRSDDESTDER